MITYLYSEAHNDPHTKMDKPKKGGWILVESPSRKEIETLINDFKLSEHYLLDALDENETPRLEVEDENTYIFTRYISFQKKKTEYATTKPVLLIKTKDYIFSVTIEKLTGIEKILNGKIGSITTDQPHFILVLINEFTERYEDFFILVSRQVKATRNRLRNQSIVNKDFILFARIEDELNEFISVLLPSNIILRRLSVGKYMNITTENETYLEDLILNNEQSVAGCKSLLKTIVNVRESYTAIISNDLNRVIKLLTILTAALTIPTLVSSLYGTNVKLPFQNTEGLGAFVFIVALSVILTFIFVIVFYRWANSKG